MEKQIERQKISLVIFYCILCWSIVLCLSCSRDFQGISGEEKESLPGWVSIWLSEPDGGVTYSAVVENRAEYNLQNLAVYMFEGTGDNYVLAKIFSDDKDNIKYNKGHFKAQYIRLNVSGCTNGDKRFIVVANVNGEGQMLCPDLKSIQVGTSLADFLNLAYEMPEENSAAFLSSIVKEDLGLPMTASQSGNQGKPYVEISLNVSTGTNVSGVSLERRVARIDIVNDEEDTKFTLEKILLKGIPTAAYLCNVEAAEVTDNDYEEELDLSGLIKNRQNYSFYVFPGTIISKNDSEDQTPTIILQGKRQEYYPLTNEWAEKDNIRFLAARIGASDLLAKANSKYNLNIPAYEGGLDIYLCIGQSNMVGSAKLAVASIPEYNITIPGVYLFNGQGWELATNPLNRYSNVQLGVGHFSLAYNFAKEMRTYYPDRAVGLVHNAHGGTNLHTQWKAWTGDRFVLTQSRMAAVTASKTGVVRGILWHQGESDSSEPYRSAYMNNFITFVGAWRTILGNSDLPIVAGEILSVYSNNQKLWNEMFQVAPDEVSYMRLVSHEGTVGESGNLIHFDVPSLRLLGDRYAAAMKELRESEKVGKSTKSTGSGSGEISLSVVEDKMR